MIERYRVVNDISCISLCFSGKQLCELLIQMIHFALQDIYVK